MEASATRAQPTTAEENMRRMTDAISNRLLSGGLLHSLEQSIARVNGRLDELEGRLARREEAVNSRFDRIIQLLEQQAVRRGR
jgi:predicted alpha/beta-fold hydrolase